MKSLSRVLLFATPWTVAYQALPSLGFSRQEYWSGLPSAPLTPRESGYNGSEWQTLKTVQRDGMGREGGGFRMGNTCIPVADSFRYLAKLTQYCKV